MSGFRLNISTPWRFVHLALTPGGRIADRDGDHWLVVSK